MQQTQLTNSVTSQVYWTANARNAELRLTQQTAGNGVITAQTFDANTGLLTGVQAGLAGNPTAVQSFSYTYSLLGMLLSRGDANTGLSESFGYDSINRLTSATVGVNIKSFTYDPIGNLISKSDVGAYTYPAAGLARPHGVTSISGTTLNTSFTYDPNGNQTVGAGLSITYTSFNKPASISRGTNTVSFDHSPEHQRYKQIAPGGTTLYLGSGGILIERFAGTGGVIQWNNYLFAGGGLVGMHVERSDETTYTRYFHKDHLGSIAVITNESGAVQERLSFDAWGKRRFPDGTDDPTGSIASQTTRGFTGHEHLDDVALVHMNGRVYDPMIGRFGVPDPMTEDPFSTQGWNRYSYVGNSPVNFTDPSGYCFMGCFWRSIGKFFMKNPIAAAIFKLAVTAIASAICGPVCAFSAAVASSAFVTGVTGGKAGDIVKSALLTAVTYAAFFSMGEIGASIGPWLTPSLGPDGAAAAAYTFKVASHAGVGCMTSMVSGGSCGSGAASAGVSAAATPLISSAFPHADVDDAQFFGATAAHGLVGGVASVAGGGKFANGAVTAAFGYMFNAERKRGCGCGPGPGHNGGPPLNDGRPPLPIFWWDAGQNLIDSFVSLKNEIAGFLSAPKLHDHHIFPQTYRDYFEARGIGIDEYTVTLGATQHLRGVHGSGLGTMPGNWNAEWGKFIANNPTASSHRAFQQAGEMMDRYGLSGLRIHPYGK